MDAKMAAAQTMPRSLDELLEPLAVSRLDVETMRRDFDEAFYRAQNGDVDFVDVDLVVHFATRGWREERDPAPWFSVADYIAAHEDVRRTGANPFHHYLVFGRAEGRSVAKSRAAVLAGFAVEGPRAPSRIRGFLDGLDKGVIVGWAWDPDRPDARLAIEIWRGDHLVCVGAADGERIDLKASGVGDGRHAFAIPLPRLPAPDARTTLVVRVAGADSALGTVEVEPAGGLRAAIETVSGLTLTAAFAATAGTVPGQNVDVFVDGEKAARIEAPVIGAGQTIRATAALPARVADGAAHWFRLASEDGAVLADAAMQTEMVGTPEAALQQHARDFPAYLSASAQRRYVSLERQLGGAAAAAVARQAPGAGRVSLEAHLAQIGVAHAQVRAGIAERVTAPAPLAALKFDAPEVSIVIPVHNKFGVTYNCLAALLLAPNAATFEIIVVDDGSTDRTVDLPELVANIVYLRNEEAQGFVKSSNRGAKAARGRHVVMLNNDTEPGPGWIDALLNVFNRFADVGLVGAKLIYPDGRLQEAGGLVFSNFDIWNYGRGANPHEPRFNYVRQVDYASGACIMVAREVWDRLGGFDEHFAPAYYEDTDLAFRIRAQGLKTYYTPFAEIVHFEGQSNGVSLTSGVKKYQAINEPKFRSRWASTIRQLPGLDQPEIAKDRGQPLRALVIDAQTPQPDRDAGSYAAIQEMRLLQELGFKLTFIPQNLAYLGNYTEGLQREGVECLYAPFNASVEETLRARGAEFDLVYITRYTVARLYLDAIRAAAPRARIAFNNADLHFLREIRAAIASGDREALAEARITRDAELDVMRRVDVTLSYSDAEAAVILSHNLDATKVARCPWVVDVADGPPPFAARAGLAFLGSFQHPPNAEAMRYFVAEVMPKLRAAAPGVTLHIYGSHIGPELRRLEADDVIVEGHAERVADVYDRHRLFIAPLRSGAGLKGKVVGALAAGIPTIMSPLAAEGVGMARDVDAVVVDTPDDWVRAIVALYGDQTRWTQMSARAREFARRSFSFDKGVETMRAALAMAGVYVG